MYTAFVVDGFLAYEQFAEQHLCPGESVDVYLAELQRLSVLFGGMSDSGMMCVFVLGLQDQVKHLCTSARMDYLSIS